MKIENMKSPQGNKVPNQFVVTTKEGKWFRSYDSNIVLIDRSQQVWLDAHYFDYSSTTSKYRNMFLGGTTEKCKELIASGVYKLANLNEPDKVHYLENKSEEQ